jgi:hypothetical protein
MPSRHVADIRQVEGKTGRKLEDWCALLDAVNFLRDGYAVSHAFALAIAAHCLRPSRTDEFGVDGFWDDEEDRW